MKSIFKLGSLAAACLFAVSAQAVYVVDDFSTPAGGAFVKDFTNGVDNGVMLGHDGGMFGGNREVYADAISGASAGLGRAPRSPWDPAS